MYYVNPYKNGSRVVNQDNRNEGIYIPKGSTIRQQLKRLQAQSNYAFKRYGFLEYEDTIKDLKEAIKQGLD